MTDRAIGFAAIVDRAYAKGQKQASKKRASIMLQAPVALAGEGGPIHEMRGDGPPAACSRMVIDYRVSRTISSSHGKGGARAPSPAIARRTSAVAMAEVGELLVAA